MNLITLVAFSLSDFVSLLQLACLTSAVGKAWSKLCVIASLYQTVIWTSFFISRKVSKDGDFAEC